MGFGKLVLVAGGVTVATALCGAAWASGFALREGSADWTANAFAGDTAKAYDAATVAANPAGMTRLGANEIDASVNYVDPYTRFTGLDVSAARMVGATTSSQNGEPGLTPGAFGAWKASRDVSFGFSVTAPFGDQVAYPAGSPARFETLVARVVDLELQLAAAWQVTPKLSIGGGPVVDNLSTRFTQAVDLGPLGAATGNPVGEFEGDDTGVGFDLGSLYQVTEALRVGVNYHSRISHDVTGTEGVFIPAMLNVLSPATATALNVTDGRARTQITLPDSVNVGALWQISPDLALLAELQWTDWSLFNNLTIRPAGGGPATTAVAENWRNTMFGSLGVNWRVLDALTLQGGLGYDQSPIRGAATRYASIPDTDRIIMGVGLTYALLPGMDLQLGYGHAFGLPARVASQQGGARVRLVGSVTDSGDTVSVGVRARF